MQTSHDPTTPMETRSDPEARRKVHDLIRKAGVAMMGTYDITGACHSRPMVAVAAEGDDLWFFTRRESRKVDELRRDPRVLLDYSDAARDNWVSLVGRAQVTADHAKAKELWQEPLRTWFPAGPEDDAVALIKVDVESAEYWDQPSSKMVHAYGYVKARLTGEPPAPGDVARVNM